MPQGCAFPLRNTTESQPGISDTRRLWVPLLLLIVFLPIGCASPDAASRRQHRVAPHVAQIGPDSNNDGYRYPATPPIVNSEGLEAFANQFKRDVVVLAFWASWSKTSREDLTRLAELQREMRDSGLRVVACNFDPPDHWTARALPILLAAKANFPCVVIPRDARPGIRAWLDPDWGFDLPARFILDRRGKIVARFRGDTPIDALIARAEGMVPNGRVLTAKLRRTTGDASLQVKLVNIATGEWESLPMVRSKSGSADELALQIVDYVDARLDRAENQRIAILPFPTDSNRRKAGPYGREIASRMRDGLRKRGFFDLIGPVTAERMISRVGISAMAIDYDPAVARGRLSVDFLILGTVSGLTDTISDPSTLAADTRSEN